ncbi:MAG: diguanylate cyclase [Peptococcaceae bacterium]|nr:diguanylate cyclase [Peptococcaceae bacterium]
MDSATNNLSLGQDFVDKMFRFIPGGVSIATDAMCSTITHNPIAAAFLRVEPWQNLVVSAQDLTVFRGGAALKSTQLPLHRAALFGEIVMDEELEFVWADGVVKTAMWSAKPVMDEQGKICGAIATLQDLTLRKQIEADLRASEERYRILFTNNMDAILLTSPEGQIYHVNPATCEMFQRTEAELCAIGRLGIIDVTDPRLNLILDERSSQGSTRRELTMVRKDGSKFPAIISTAVSKDRNGQELATTIIHDITERKKIEENLRQAKEEAERIATFDYITGLLNRRAFMNRVEQEIERAKRQTTPTALIIVDVDLFKEVNDTYGHVVGDLALQKFSQCLTQSARPYDLIGRYGGEEFIICLPNTTLNDAVKVAERARVAVEQLEIMLDASQRIYLTASFGVAYMEYDSAESIDAFIARADNAMYRAKAVRNLVCVDAQEKSSS